MVQIDVTLSAAVGATLATAARVQLRAERRLWDNAYLGKTLALSGLFVVPSLLYFLGSFPAWDTMYMFGPDGPPGWFFAACGAIFFAACALGFVCGHALILKGRETLAALLPVIFAAPAGLVILAFPRQFLHVGSRASFDAGAPVNFLGSGVFWTFIVVMPFTLVLPLGVVVWRWAQPAIDELKARRATRRVAA